MNDVTSVKRVARWSLGIVWLYEGLVLKLLFVHPEALDLVSRSGVGHPNPSSALSAAGVLQVAVGLWLLSGRAERAAVLLASFAALVIPAVVAVLDPSALIHPFAGLPKNVALLACGWTVWSLSERTPGE
jgi:uncharacterized membrane protein YphA (DoxX/SURF4 family)